MIIGNDVVIKGMEMSAPARIGLDTIRTSIAAGLLKTYFKVDSIYAKFNANNSYQVESYSSGTKTTYSGVSPKQNLQQAISGLLHWNKIRQQL